MKKRWIALAIAVASVSGCGKTAGDAIGKAVLDTALQIAPMDATVLSEITERLEQACESGKNKFGLSAEQCSQKLNERKDLCVQQTAQKYPGQMSNADRMQEVMSSHVDCLFKG